MNMLHVDEAVLIVDKPVGLPVLPDGWDKDAPYLLKLLEELYGRLWVVHRLDKVTSGVMVFARTADAHRALNMQFERREAQKVYHAICVGAPVWDEHTARHRLRVNVGHSHRTAVDNSHGLAAETHFKVLKRYPGHGLLESRPATGRTHQIRVHAYALGYPLLGDILYTPPVLRTSLHFTRASPAPDAGRCAVGTGEPQNGGNEGGLIARPALHAFSLTFTHPLTNERSTFEAPYPADFARALLKLDIVL